MDTFQSSPTTQLLFADNSSKYWDISMAVLEQNKLTNNLLHSIPDSLQKEYANIAKLLERIYSEDCEQAAVAEETAEIKIIADKAKEFADSHQFYKLYNAISHTYVKIENFNNSRQNNTLYLPHSIVDSLKSSINIHKESINSLVLSCQSIVDISNYNDKSKTRKLREWAKALETLGDTLEDNIEFISIDILEQSQSTFSGIIKMSQKKQSNFQARENKRESYRVRIRNAAGFISRLIDSVVEESDAEDREILTAISTANHPVFFED
jgi:hypothetical protein